jgi:hypothetical protein
MTKSFELPTREMTALDRRFVVPTWARSAQYGLSMPEQFRIVDRTLDAGARVLVMATDERTVHAWLAYDDDVMHYVYVPPELRGNGLARALTAKAFGERGPAFITHTTTMFGMVPRARFNPYLLAISKAA